MSRVNQAQMKKLLDLLSEDGVMVRGKVVYTNTNNKQTFWKRIAMQLNAVDGGVHKTTWKWCKMWADWKNKTKRKADILLRKSYCNYYQQPPTLTNLELRLLKIIEYPIDDKTHNLKLEENKDEPQTVVEAEFLNEDCNDNTSCNEDDKTLEFFTRNKRKVKHDEDDKSVISEESSDIEKKAKVKGKTFKKKKISLQAYKIKSSLELEKERMQQKNEELRLRALELKLKGEELRLKEIEMNKINFLTNIEEEKLKCFRDISSSLKELLERNRNGNLRFNVI